MAATLTLETVKSNSLSVIGTTDAFVVPAGEVILVFAGGRRTPGSAGTPSNFVITDSEGLSWTFLHNSAVAASAEQLRLSVWYAVSNGNSMTVTIANGATPPNASAGAAVVGVSGAILPITNKDGSISATGDPSLDLPVLPNVSSTVVAAIFGGGADQSITPPTNYTELTRFATPINNPIQIVYDQLSAAQNATWSTPLAASCSIMFEILGTSAFSFGAIIG